MIVEVIVEGEPTIDVETVSSPPVDVLMSSATVVDIAGLGPTGPPGPPGADGATGATGADGAPGAPGPGVAAGGTTGQILTKDTATDFDTSWQDAPAGGGSGAPAAKIGPPGHFVWGWPVATLTTSAYTAGQMRLVRILAEQAFDQVVVDVATAAAGTTIAVGLYSCNATGMPTTLADSVTGLDSATTGNRLLTCAAARPAGLYWVAVIPTGGNPTMRASNNYNPYSLSATPAAMDPTINSSSWNVTGTAALPNPFSGTPVNASPSTHVQLRLA